MPRRRDRQTEEFGPLTEEQERYLTDPQFVLSWWTFTPDEDAPFPSTEAQRAAWGQHGERLIREYRGENGGEWPIGAIWYGDAPEDVEVNVFAP